MKTLLAITQTVLDAQAMDLLMRSGLLCESRHRTGPLARRLELPAACRVGLVVLDFWPLHLSLFGVSLRRILTLFMDLL
jgi:hypothetical protein